MGQVGLSLRGRGHSFRAMTRAEEMDWETAAAAFAWQFDLGATEAICDGPVNRYELEVVVPKAAPVVAAPAVAAEVDPVAEARALAAAAQDLDGLREAMAGFSLCELKQGAKNTVFSDGRAGARVMIIGEAPGRDEDAAGRPFVGRAGQLLDRMFAAIGLSREAPGLEQAIYVTNVMPWRPPQNRDPDAREIAMMKPFLARHVELAQPEVLVVVGNCSADAVLGQRGITRLRGKWGEGLGLPVMPMCHPAYLLRNPAAKREAWADLLEVRARL